MQLDIFAEPDGSCGKTSPAHSAATVEQTLLAWSVKWLGQSSMSSGANGKTPELLPDQTGSSSGACLTLNMSEWNHTLAPSRSGGAVCSLSSILETGIIDRRYYLSPKACAGILRRAGRRGKTLPMTRHG